MDGQPPPPPPLDAAQQQQQQQHVEQPPPPPYDAAAELKHEQLLVWASHFLLLWLFAAQFAVVWWKKNRPQQYFAFSLAGLWTIPVAAAAYLGNWRFVACCAVFTMQAAYVLRIATARPMQPDTPQFVYRTFLVMHRVTFAMATFGAASFVLTLFVVIPLLDTAFPTLVMDEVLLIFYGGYFGVMQRDFAQVISEKMTRSMGLMGPGKGRQISNTCALCGHELRTLEALEIGKDATKKGLEDRKTWKLACGQFVLRLPSS